MSFLPGNVLRLLLAVTCIWRRRGASIRPVLWATLATVGFGSLAYGIHPTGSSPSLAYFSTSAPPA